MAAESEVVPVTADMMAAETLGNYDLLRRLGAGGMAEVHLARQHAIEGFQKLVVLKQVLPHLARDPHFVRMFLEEARLAALLDHPNVVQVFDLGTEEGDFFFTMEFVYGETLQSLVRSLNKAHVLLPFEHTLTIAMQVAAGLHYAHERVGFDGRPLGIVHRDVSPTNIMITYEGGVKVADFGIAKVVTRTDVTRAGIRKGKVPYMSPEQCRAQQIDRRSDVFSLGIVMWEITTGKRLFDGDNEFGVMNRIVNGDIPLPSTVRAAYPKELERIVMRALAVDRDRRYATTRDLQLDLEALARDKKWRATPSALSELMHELFRPKPFPWGALMGDGVSGSSHLATVASASLHSVPGSSPSATLGQDMTPASHVGSYHSVGGSMGSSLGSLAVHSNRARTLRGLAIGLGSVAAVAVLLVGGIVAMDRFAGDDAKSAAAQDDDTAAPAEAAASAPLVAPAVVEDEDDEDAQAPAAEAEGGAAAPADEDVAAEGDEAPEEDVVVEDEPEDPEDADPAPAAPKTKPRTKAKTSTASSTTTKKKPKAKPKETKKKPNLDAFLPQ